jgi:Flp pilus assembly protein TadG
MPSFKRARKTAAGEDGAALVITMLVMLSLLIFAAFAIDTAIWFVHDRHLQIEADAAAFAGADVMAAGMINGTCSDSGINTAIANYDGSQAPVAAQQLPANQQVGASTYATTYSGTANNLFAQVNAKNFENQSLPNDTDLTSTTTGLASTSPCADSAVDVKMTETNVPSFLSLIHPSYVNKQARVKALTVSIGNSSPFVLPNIQTPPDAAVFVVAEDPATPAFSTDAVLAAVGSCADSPATSPCLTSSNSNATWTTPSNLSVTFGTRPVSLVVAQSTSSISSATLSGVTSGATLVTFCNTSGITCYDTADNKGLTYTRIYTAGTANFPTAAPIVEDTSLSDLTMTSTCEGSGSTGYFTGFSSSNTACTVSFTADMNFGSETCAALTGSTGNQLNATLTITASSGGSATLSCPNTGAATGSWTSGGISIPANTGPVTFDLTWSRTGGGSTVPREGWEDPTSGFTTGGNSGQCGSSPHNCTADFKIVQRLFSGAFDQASAMTSHSGSVAGAALTTPMGELTSTPANGTLSNLGVTIDFQALSDTAAAAGGNVPGVPFADIAFGQNQANGLADCGQGTSNQKDANKFDVQEDAIAGLFVCSTYPVIPAPGTCGTCPGLVPGQSKFVQYLDAGMAARIYGCPEVTGNGGPGIDGCNGAPNCTAHPNYWSTQNLMSSLEANSSDPRLLSVMVTDPGTLPNGAGTGKLPVRHYATFYVTGWTGDPCSGQTISGTTNGLHYVSEDTAPTDAAGDIFLVGHFIKYFQPGAIPSGTTCVISSLDNCTLTLTQ